jgi:hypothetical protein
MEEANRFASRALPADDRTAVAIRFTDAARQTAKEEHDEVELAFAAA